MLRDRTSVVMCHRIRRKGQKENQSGSDEDDERGAKNKIRTTREKEGWRLRLIYVASVRRGGEGERIRQQLKGRTKRV